MILCCDFNPKLTRKFYVKEFFKHKHNLAQEVRVYPSGAGIDMAVFAQMLSAKVKVFFPEGMETGKWIASYLRESGIDFYSVKIKDENIECVTVKQKHNKTEIATAAPRITMEDKNDILAAFYQQAKENKIVCLPEIDHPALSEDLFEQLISYCYQNNIKIATTLSDRSKLNGAKPFLLLLDKEELSQEQPIRYAAQVVAEGKSLLNSGIGVLVVVSSQGAIIMTKEKNYRAYFIDRQKKMQKLNKNLMLMGFAMGIEREYNFETTMKLGISCGIWENFHKFRHVEMSEIKTLMNIIELEELGEVL